MIFVDNSVGGIDKEAAPQETDWGQMSKEERVTAYAGIEQGSTNMIVTSDKGDMEALLANGAEIPLWLQATINEATGLQVMHNPEYKPGKFDGQQPLRIDVTYSENVDDNRHTDAYDAKDLYRFLVEGRDAREYRRPMPSFM